jgi:hypothetical protein
VNKVPENKDRFRGLKSNQTQNVGQYLLLSRLSLSAPEFHRVMPVFQEGKPYLNRLVGCTTDRELHPAPKVDIQLEKIITLA